MVLAVIDDLMFRSRVSSAAKASGADVRFVSGDAEVLSRLPESLSLIIIDLNGRRHDPVALVRRLKSDPALQGVRVIGFVSHVDAATIESAREAGIDVVLPRGAFVTHLPQILAGGGPLQDPTQP